MKINSRKFLVYAYALRERKLGYDQLVYLWPEMTDGGRRGVIAHLLKQRLISVTYNGKLANFRLSSIGKAWVEANYAQPHPALPSQAGWLVIIYPSLTTMAPKVKKLKQLLKTECTEFSPKLFFSHQELSTLLLAKLKREFFAQVAVVALREWLMGEPIDFQNSYLQKNGMENSLSGISSELSELIDKKNLFLDMNHQSKLRLYSLLDRLFLLIEQNGEHPLGSQFDFSSAAELLKMFASFF